MHGQGKDVPAAGTATDKDLGFTHAELQDAWLSLYEPPPPPLAEGETYVARLAELWGIERHCVAARLKKLKDAGTVEYVGLRLVGGRPVKAWRMCK